MVLGGHLVPAGTVLVTPALTYLLLTFEGCYTQNEITKPHILTFMNPGNYIKPKCEIL